MIYSPNYREAMMSTSWLYHQRMIQSGPLDPIADLQRRTMQLQETWEQRVRKDVWFHIHWVDYPIAIKWDRLHQTTVHGSCAKSENNFVFYDRFRKILWQNMGFLLQNLWLDWNLWYTELEIFWRWIVCCREKSLANKRIYSSSGR